MINKTMVATLALVLSAMSMKAQTQYAWQDTKLPRAERVESLLGMLTPEEKVGLMMNKSISIDRLGIPSYNWWSEACHGVRQSDYTVYPQPIGMAAAFNEQLVYDVFSQVSDEARANWNRSDHSVKHVGMGEIYYPGNPELTFWCPNVNIFRDPRWGRGQETCGEDPYLNAVLGVATVKGMQSPLPLGGDGGGLYVSDCALESDLEMYFPETYVPGSSERMLLYRELDNLEEDRDLEAYRKRLEDRFGPVPHEGEELMQVVRLRRLGKTLGCEKLILKQGRMQMQFVSQPNSPFYQSEAFDRVLNFLMSNPRRCNLKEIREKRSMVVANVPTVGEAVNVLQAI